MPQRFQNQLPELRPDGWDLGMRVDSMYGTSSRFVNQTGLELNSDFTQNWNGNNRFYGADDPRRSTGLALGY